MYLIHFHACNAAQPTQNLLVLCQEILTKNELIWSKSQLFYTHQVVNYLVNSLLILLSDTLQDLLLLEAILDLTYGLFYFKLSKKVLPVF